MDAAAQKFPISPVMAGVNNNKWYDDSQGLWDDTADQPVADAVNKVAGAGVGLIRRQDVWAGHQHLDAAVSERCRRMDGP